MIADVPLGAFLSGGVDSTAVVSLMTELSSVPVRTFTVGFDVPQFDESKHAAAVANHLGTDHRVEYLTEQDALALIGHVPTMYGEPFADSSALPTHLVARMARREVTVSLSGDGGDEAFGGYHRYTTLAQLGRAFRLLDRSGPFRDVLVSVLSRFPGRLGRGGALLRLPQSEVSQRMIRVFSANDARALGGCLLSLGELERAWASSAELPLQQRAMLVDLLTYLPEAILVKVDRAAMATSLETRAPLLDHRVLEFALQLPAHLVRGKCLLKRLVYRRVPRAIMDRKKQGFGVPLSRWFRGELRPLLCDMLTARRMHAVGLQDFSIVRRMIDEHMAGTYDRELELWTLLVLGMWADAHSRREVRTPARWSVQLV
jgi:asparagine synthase (glutamine-hydrolysing)